MKKPEEISGGRFQSQWRGSMPPFKTKCVCIAVNVRRDSIFQGKVGRGWMLQQETHGRKYCELLSRSLGRSKTEGKPKSREMWIWSLPGTAYMCLASRQGETTRPEPIATLWPPSQRCAQNNLWRALCSLLWHATYSSQAPQCTGRLLVMWTKGALCASITQWKSTDAACQSLQSHY